MKNREEEITDDTLVILFGSRARGTERMDSDADIGILSAFGHKLSASEKISLAEKISRQLGVSEDKIDLVDLSRASPLLQYQAAREGRILFGSTAKFIRFQVLAWKRYLSTAKFRRMREQSLAKKYA